MRIYRQRSLILILLTCVALTGWSNILAQETPRLIEYTVTAESANVRSTAGTNAPIVGKVSAGDILLVYDEEQQTEGWLRIHDFNDSGTDAYIADFLVERAPVRFYPASLEPVFEVSGRGRDISDVFDLPGGVYRVDASVKDNYFILKTVVVAGNCDDDIVFNEGASNARSLEISGLLVVPGGCSLIFETDNVDGNWNIAVRDLMGMLKDSSNWLEFDESGSISGRGRALTMPTRLTSGIWSINAKVQSRAFILWARAIGDCDEEVVFNELDFDQKSLDVSAVYRVAGECLVFWETSNVDGEWELAFKKIR